MAKWNDMPFDENASPEVKALEFNLQVLENGGQPYPEPDITWNSSTPPEERRNG